MGNNPAMTLARQENNLAHSFETPTSRKRTDRYKHSRGIHKGCLLPCKSEMVADVFVEVVIWVMLGVIQPTHRRALRRGWGRHFLRRRRMDCLQQTGCLPGWR